MERKRPAEAGRFCQLRIGVADLLVRFLGRPVTLGGSLALLAGLALLCGGIVQKFAPTGRAFPVMALVAAIIALLAITSYVYEKD